ncbi:YceD family protein [Marinibacterium sp. SX1]|uniref:YceD family protein n=1 Tax=Marinibacterium sp. SX1 TaxID=3388424 RepID=UPI003D183398
MTDAKHEGDKMRVADLSQAAPTAFALKPDAPALKAIAAELGLEGLRKLRFEGRIAAEGKRDWLLTGRLGATVVQPCVVTLAPVTSRVESDVRRLYVAGMETPEGEEIEMPEDDDQEPLGREIDLGAVMIEALSLALPLYPRADTAELGDAVYTEPGKTAMTDEDTRPFAALAALKGLGDSAGGENEDDDDSGKD